MSERRAPSRNSTADLEQIRMKLMLRRFTHAMLVVALTACASAGNASGTPKDSSVITREEIATSMESNAYDAVARLRPLFLKSRGRTTINGEVNDYATVFVDGVRYGDLS